MKYFLIVIFVGISILSFAEKTVSRAIYEAEVDKLNCELAKFYMEQNQGFDTLRLYEDSLAITGCNFEHLMVFIKERQPEMRINGELAVYIESLKADYTQAANNNVLYYKLIEIFSQETLDRYSHNDVFIGLTNTLKDRLKQNLQVQLKEDLQITETENAVNQEVLETNSFTDYFKDFGWQEAALILITIFIISIFVSLIGWFYKYSTTGKVTSIKSNPPQQTTTNQQQIITHTTTTINDVHAKPKVVQNTMIPPTIVNVPPPTKTQIIDKVEAEIVQDKVDDLPNENIFYMPYPTVDGSFYEYGKHDLYEEGRSTFKFEIRLKEYNLATFEVISNQDVITDALMNFEKTLNAVCEVVGKGTEHDKNHEIIVQPGLKRIVTIEPGTVQLQTQHWRLKQKAKIRLEY